MTNQLTEDEYKSTMTGRMIDVTETAEAIVDVWPYVQQLTIDHVLPRYVYQEQLVEAVSRNDADTFDHVIIPTDTKNVFVIIIVDIKQEAIKGHYILDLNKEYGL